MTEIPGQNDEDGERTISPEEIAEVCMHLGAEAADKTITIDSEADATIDAVPIAGQETASMIDAYLAEHGSVKGLQMDELLESGFDPDMILRKIGGQRLEEKLEIVKISYGAERGTEQWQQMEKIEARSIPISDKEVDALLEAGANPQHIIDAIQQVEPEDDKDNYSSSRVAARIGKLVEAGLPPSTIAARLNPSWREHVRDELTDAEEKWRQANRLKAAA